MLARTPLLIEAVNKKVSRLHIFDMDGTLLLSPEPHWAKKFYSDHHPAGGTWEGDHGKDWWGHPASITGHPHKPFPIKPVEHTLKNFQAAHRDNGSRVVIMTGRKNTPEMRDAVSHALRKSGVSDKKGRELRHGVNLFLKRTPHPQSVKPGKKPEKVLTHIWKGEMLHRFADEHPDLRHIHIWDDRILHAKYLANVAKERGIATTINHVQHPDWSANMSKTS